MSAERREGVEVSASSDDGRDELKSMLDTIGAQLADADKRHMAALSEMQERISELGREADTLRSRVPDQFAPAFQKIEAGIGELANRLADPVRGAGRRGVASPGHGETDPSDPWDQASAEALAGAYEASGYAAPDSSEDAGSAHIDEAWLESRFAEIARGIEYSISQVKPETDLSDLGQRFDEFERQFAKLFAGVATHDDFSIVRKIETHMDSVVRQLERTNDQLGRLNSLEAQIAAVSKTLGEMQASANGAPADIGAVARAAAEETLQRIGARSFNDRNSSTDELRPLIEQLMSENRQGGEHTAALLDTMQQAMVRLLDRVEAIDFAPPPPRIFEEDPASNFAAEFETRGVAPSDLPTGAPERDGLPAGAAASSSRSGHDTGLSSEEMAIRSEKLRQEFIADARRAKARLGGESDNLEGSLSLSPAGTQSTASSAPLGGSRPIRPAQRTAKKNTSGPSAPSPLLIFIAAVVLIALAGLWFGFGFDNKAEPIGAPGITSQNRSAAPATAPATPSDTPANAPASPAPQEGTNGGQTPGVNGPRGDIAPGGTGESHAEASDASAPEPRTALPMIGVAVDLDRPVTQAELLQARRHQIMANMSGELGSAAARPGESAPVPASMVPTEAETEGNAAQGKSDAPQRPQGPSRLELPAATIGPLSLRLAAANGDPSAQFEVGARFAEGAGVKQNFAEAAKWYQRSADQGFAQAQYRLGTLYERGLGLKPDRSQAAIWYRRAADQGNIKAMHNMAVLFANQSDRSPDYMAAAQWFTEAAKRGLPDSQFNLGILYENGLGVPRNLKQAFLWLSLAAQGGDADAIRRRDILRGKLSAQEMAEAQKMIASWRITPSERTINDALAAGELWKKNPKNGING